MIRPEAIAAREAFDLAAAGQTSKAADRLQLAINDIENPAMRGRLMEQKASYLHFTGPVAAQRLVAAAVQQNGFVLHPASGIAPAPPKAAVVQASAPAAFLAAEYDDGIMLVLAVMTMLDEIQWDEERTDEAERAWQRLGQHLGFTSTRPEQLYGFGPDNLWVLECRPTCRDRAEDRMQYQFHCQEGP